MVSSSLDRPSTKHMLRKPIGMRFDSVLDAGRNFRIAAALAIFIFVAALVPEQPVQKASICERHNSIAACRIW